MKPETVTVSKAEYERYQRDAKLLSEYKAMNHMREWALRDHMHRKAPSLFDGCGNALGPR